MLVFNQVLVGGLERISCSIKTGEFVCIYDPDVQRLTVLRDLIRGTVRPISGVVNWLNHHKNYPELWRRDMGTVYRRNIMLEDRSIMDNLSFILEIRGSRRASLPRRASKVLEMVGLAACQNLHPGELLPHQLVRANIAQALLNYPSLLLVEDITVNLDEVNSMGIIHLMHRLNRLALTVILLSSDRRVVPIDGMRRIILSEMTPERDSRGYICRE